MGLADFGIDIAGDTISSALNYGVERRLQSKNMRFQKHMAQNKYQYAVDDMKQAGLNPILALSKGMAPGASGSSAAQSHASSTGQTAQKRLINAQIAKVNSEKALIDNKKDSTDPMAVLGEVLGKWLTTTSKEVDSNPVKKLIEATTNIADPKAVEPTPEVKLDIKKRKYPKLKGVKDSQRKNFKFDNKR